MIETTPATHALALIRLYEKAIDMAATYRADVDDMKSIIDYFEILSFIINKINEIKLTHSEDKYERPQGVEKAKEFLRAFEKANESERNETKTSLKDILADGGLNAFKGTFSLNNLMHNLDEYAKRHQYQLKVKYQEIQQRQANQAKLTDESLSEAALSRILQKAKPRLAKDSQPEAKKQKGESRQNMPKPAADVAKKQKTKLAKEPQLEVNKPKEVSREDMRKHMADAADKRAVKAKADAAVGVAPAHVQPSPRRKKSRGPANATSLRPKRWLSHSDVVFTSSSQEIVCDNKDASFRGARDADGNIPNKEKRANVAYLNMIHTAYQQGWVPPEVDSANAEVKQALTDARRLYLAIIPVFENDSKFSPENQVFHSKENFESYDWQDGVPDLLNKLQLSFDDLQDMFNKPLKKLNSHEHPSQRLLSSVVGVGNANASHENNQPQGEASEALPVVDEPPRLH